MEEYVDILDKITTTFLENEIQKTLSFHEYQRLMNDLLMDNNFFLIQEKIRYIRAYGQALDFFLFLLSKTEEFKNKLTDEEYDIHRKPLYINILWSLDKMDLWENYLDAWEQIKENTSGKDEHHHFYVRSKKINEEVKYIHFLDFYTMFRKPIIEGKAKKKKEGKKIGNMYHSSQSDFTEAELKDRLDKFFGRKPYWIHDIDNEKDVTPDK